MLMVTVVLIAATGKRECMDYSGLQMHFSACCTDHLEECFEKEKLSPLQVPAKRTRPRHLFGRPVCDVLCAPDQLSFIITSIVRHTFWEKENEKRTRMSLQT